MTGKRIFCNNATETAQRAPDLFLTMILLHLWFPARENSIYGLLRAAQDWRCRYNCAGMLELVHLQIKTDCTRHRAGMRKMKTEAIA